ncbi:gamma-tubulin complex component 5 [Ceratobasidium sp. AG-Ba]|nr:gamma-tubulin complex component 5 [Ceratobasidium sp. AG-Ba]
MKKNQFTSSASANRPVSRLSTVSNLRTASRLSHRTLATSARLRSTHVQRIAGLLRTLVQQVTGVGPEDDPDEFQEYVGSVFDLVLNGSGSTNDSASVAKRIAGHREKARINLHHELANAITMSYRQMNSLVASEDRDPDDPIKRTNLPDMLHFLLELSQRPDNATHIYAQNVLDAVKAPPPVPEDFWKKVLEEEPFEGEHWQDQWGDGDDDDAKSLSSHPSLELDSRHSTPTTESTSNHVGQEEKYEESVDPEPSFDWDKQYVLNDAHTLYEALCKEQYWRPGYVNEAARQAGKRFSVNEPATLAPSFERVIVQEGVGLREVYVDESDVVRDVLITIQGRESVIFRFYHDGDVFRRVETVPSLPRISHFTLASYRSLLSAFATTATTLQHLRAFVTSVFETSMGPSTFTPTITITSDAETAITAPTSSIRRFPCRTLDAFAEALDVRLRALDTYCSDIETQIANARLGSSSTPSSEPLIVSLLNLRRRLDQFMSRTYDVLYDLIKSLPDEVPAQGFAHPRSYYEMGSGSTVVVLTPLPLESIYAIHPALMSKRLLDRLFLAVRACNRDGSPSSTIPNANSNSASDDLMSVFIATTEPLWASVGAWVKWGIDVARDALDDTAAGNDLASDLEFFVRRREGVDVTSSDFWTAGYVLRTNVEDEDDDEDEGKLAVVLAASHGAAVGSRSRGLLDPRSGTLHGVEAQPKGLVPDCLMPIAAQVLAAGKAIGLLRAIGVWGESVDGYESLDGEEQEDREDESWPTFAETLKEAETSGILDLTLESGPLEDLSRYNLDDTIVPDSSLLANQPLDEQPDYPIAPSLASEVLLNDLPHILADKVSPRCQIAAFRLNRVLVEDCELWAHLRTMEDLCFMRRGDVMTHFCDVLFARIEMQKPWSDYHLLNSSFRDVLSATSASWIDVGRVRLIYKGTKARSSARSMRAIHGLAVEYEFPFPLSYMFGTTALDVYSQVFVLVLQLRRAKMVLDRILVRDVGAYREELKMVYVLRGQLMWFVNMYTNFILTNVIYTQVMRFHKELAEVKSLDEMILKHRTHLETIQEQCCLRSKDSNIHKTVISILDMCIQFGDLFASVVADTTLDLSRPPVGKGIRRRRDLAARSNLVTFIPPPEADIESVTSDELGSEPDLGLEETELEVTTMEPTIIGNIGDDWAERVERMAKGLDGLVRLLRRSAEVLSGSVGRSAGAFGMLEFALEDWDL